MITEKDISFENDCQDKRTHWQDIVYKGKTIGAIAHVDRGFMNELEIHCQKLVPESEIPFVQDHYQSEDDGFVFATFRDENMGIDTFLKYINERCKI